MWNTIIQDLGEWNNNHLYIKRDDLIPYSFGGNKARKAALFFEEIEKGNYDCVVTYGSGSSNHCRIISNMCAAREMPCHIVRPREVVYPTFNAKMMTLFGSEITETPVSEVQSTINTVLDNCRRLGYNPFFIEGGGHGNIGTEAYVQCYHEIKRYEKKKELSFDYIFFASGTGTTQAGLVCGQMLFNDNRKIIGISIARKNPRGRDVVIDSIKSYLKDAYDEETADRNTFFVDDYAKEYGEGNEAIYNCIKTVLVDYGIPLDATYTGKAFWGMKDYVNSNDIRNANLLFLHTGGTPLFFDALDTI